jgi:hypothetical protein
MANEIDELMDRDPLELTKDDIANIVKYHRSVRHQIESGHKPKKDTGPKLSLDSVLKNLIPAKPAAPPMKRRI